MTVNSSLQRGENSCDRLDTAPSLWAAFYALSFCSGSGAANTALAVEISRPRHGPAGTTLVRAGNAGIAREAECRGARHRRPCRGDYFCKTADRTFLVGRKHRLRREIVDDPHPRRHRRSGRSNRRAARRVQGVLQKALCTDSGFRPGAYGLFPMLPIRWLIRAQGAPTGRGRCLAAARAWWSPLTITEAEAAIAMDFRWRVRRAARRCDREYLPGRVAFLRYATARPLSLSASAQDTIAPSIHDLRANTAAMVPTTRRRRS